MCLIIEKEKYASTKWYNKLGFKSNPVPLIATEDITCYKVYRSPIASDLSDLISYFMFTPHNYGSQPQVRIKYMGSINVNETYVEDGYHSIASVDDRNLLRMKEGKNEMVECIIPKGSKYFIGTFSGSTGYVSDNLIIVKPVKP